MKIISAATPITLTPEERKALEALASSRKAEARMRDRARIVLMASTSMASRAIAREVGCKPGTVSKWRVRYANDRMAGLRENGGRGKQPQDGPEHGQRVLALLDKPPPAGYSNWTAPLLARELVDIHEQQIWRFLRVQKIGLSGRKSWCQSTDPDFVSKAAEIVGLYMAPPTNAVVLSVDEKPSIRRWSALRDTSNRRREGQVSASYRTTSGMAHRRCSPRSTWAVARSSANTTSAVAGSNFA